MVWVVKYQDFESSTAYGGQSFISGGNEGYIAMQVKIINAHSQVRTLYLIQSKVRDTGDLSDIVR